MQLTRLKIKNYKKIKDLDQDLRGNVFVVKGDNDEGKSTFARSFMKLITKVEKPEVPVTQGETNGQIQGEFINPNGEKYTVVLDFTNEKESIKMVAPDGISTSKVNEIRSLFDYNYVDVDEFIAWSTTAEGRRKQRETVLKLLPRDKYVEFIKLEQHEKEKYDLRTVKNVAIKAQEAVVQKFILSIEESATLSNEEVVLSNFNLLKEKSESMAENLLTIEKKTGELNLVAERYKNLTEQQAKLPGEWDKFKTKSEADILELETKLAVMKDAFAIATSDFNKSMETIATDIEKETIAGNQINLEIEEITKLVEPDIKVKLEVATTSKDSIVTIKTKKAEHTKESESLTKTKLEAENLSNEIEKARKEKQEVVTTSNLPIAGLSIDEDGITLNGLPFTKEQLSTSEIMSVVFHILIALNKKTPIVYLGRAESLGPDKLQSIINEAIKNNCQLFIDKVVGGAGLVIEILEDVKPDTKTNLI